MNRESQVLVVEMFSRDIIEVTVGFEMVTILQNPELLAVAASVFWEVNSKELFGSEYKDVGGLASLAPLWPEIHETGKNYCSTEIKESETVPWP